MKALIFLGAGKNKLEWQEKPDLTVQGDLEAIVRPIASATCDLDREILRGTVPMSQHPGFAIGHECVAEVLEVGDKVRLHKRGDIVVVPCFISSGVCVQCRAGMHSHCTTVSPVASERVYGLPTGKKDWGGLFSEEVRVPFADGMLVPVPVGVDPVSVASASDNMVDAYITVRRGLAKHPGAPTLVVGGVDSFGLFVAEQAKAQGSERVDYYDRDPQRRAAARLLGCEVLSEMPEVDRHYPFVVFASRDNAELEPAVRTMAPGGHIQLLTGFFGGPVKLNLWEWFMRDITLAIGIPNSKANIPAVLEQVRCGHIHALAAGAASVDYIDPNPVGREIAQELGARVYEEYDPAWERRFPVVIFAGTTPTSLRTAFTALRPGGHLSQVMIFFQDTAIPMEEIYFADITFSNGRPSTRPHIPAVLELCRCGKLHPEKMVSKIIAWDDAPEALIERTLMPVVARQPILSRRRFTCLPVD